LSPLDATDSKHGKRTLEIKPKAVTSPERFARHGHRPAIFLIPDRDSIAESVDRALFELGFETNLLWENSFSSGALAALLNVLWSAGLIVLLVSDRTSTETRQILKTVAGDSLFDWSNEESQFTHEAAVTKTLSQAEALRIRNAAGNFRKG